MWLSDTVFPGRTSNTPPERCADLVSADGVLAAALRADRVAQCRGRYPRWRRHGRPSGEPALLPHAVTDAPVARLMVRGLDGQPTQADMFHALPALSVAGGIESRLTTGAITTGLASAFGPASSRAGLPGG